MTDKRFAVDIPAGSQESKMETEPIGVERERCEISVKELNELRDASIKLHALEAAGVDNWEGYEEAMKDV